MIYCCGADGSGKSTYLREIESELQKRGYKTTSIWIRSPKILSKPLMLYCHLTGLTKYRYIDGIKFGNHAFERSPLVRFLFPILQLCDFKIKWLAIRSRARDADYILMDRFVLDTLIDLMVSTKRFDLHKTWIGRAFLRMLPQGALLLCFDAEADLIRSRKADTKHDVNLDMKLNLYIQLSEFMGMTPITNNSSFEEVRGTVLDSLTSYLAATKS